MSSAYLGRVLEWLDNDRAALANIVAKFLDDCPAKLGNIREALTAGDASRLASAARNFRGTLMLFEACESIGLTDRLEELAKRRDFGAAARVAGALEDAARRLGEDLSNEAATPR
ncbi:MAG: hypothetical protein HY900_19385 [Deltaproteobacteria bacterium]|nr:hypothetical protein [Deltaproteobacteria bacterium]